MFLLTGAALFVNVIFLGNALNTMFVYVWARRNPYIRMAFFGILNFQVHLWRFLCHLNYHMTFRRHIYHMSWHYFHWLLVRQFWWISWASCVAIFIIILKMSSLILKVVLGKRHPNYTPSGHIITFSEFWWLQILWKDYLIQFAKREWLQMKLEMVLVDLIGGIMIISKEIREAQVQ